MNLVYKINSVKLYISEQTNKTKLNEEFVGYFEQQSERSNIDAKFFLIAASFKWFVAKAGRISENGIILENPEPTTVTDIITHYFYFYKLCGNIHFLNTQDCLNSVMFPALSHDSKSITCL